ncbi:MAG: c-type cytochrome [Pirellulaceae bacterium]
MKQDPFTQGPKVFAKYCASCHRYDGHDGRGRLIVERTDEGNRQVVLPTATDLGDFAKRSWWKQLLTNYSQHLAPLVRSDFDLENSEMAGWCNDNRQVLLDSANAADLDAIVEFLVAQAANPLVEVDQDKVDKGEALLTDLTLTNGEISSCTDCHASLGGEFELDADNSGYPELNGYGSKAWLTAFIQNPGSPQFYGDANQMPAFAGKMSNHELEMLVRWMCGDYPPTHVESYESKLDQSADASDAAEATEHLE